MIDNINNKSFVDGSIEQSFSGWRKYGDPKDLEKIQIWSYFKIREFFIKRCLRDNLFKPSDVDILIEKAYFRFLKHHEKVKKPENFTAWLKVVCTYALFEFVKLKKYTSESLADEINENDYPINDRIITDIIKKESERDLTIKIKKLMTDAEAGVVIRKIFENKPNQVIANELSINEQSVKNFYYRGCEKLRKASFFKDLLQDKTNQFY